MGNITSCPAYTKKRLFGILFLLLLPGLLAMPGAACARGNNITRITRISLSGAAGTISVYTYGNPEYKKYEFKNGTKNYFILSFARSVLYGHGQKIKKPFKDVFSVSYSQFSAAPNYSVHIVIKRKASVRPEIRTLSLGGGRYKIVIYMLPGSVGRRTRYAQSPDRPAAKQYSANFNVFIDAGHGGGDPGGIGPMGLPESFVNLSIALKLKKFLEAKGIKTEIDRTSNINLSLQERAEEANRSGANLFIGLYCNSTVVPYLYGTTSYYFHPGSYRFAEYLNSYISSTLNLKNDGIKKDDLYVLRFTRMPAVVIEYAYISNPYEEGLLGSSTFRRLIANGIANAVYKYFVVEKR